MKGRFLGFQIQNELFNWLTNPNNATDRGQNRYSDFVALETLLRFENCSSSNCLLSSWRRFVIYILV